MKNIKVIVAIHVVFLALIIGAFLPALNSGDEGYNTKKEAVMPVQQQDIAAAEDIEDEESTTVTDEEVLEEPAPLATTVEDKVEEVVEATESVVNDVISTVESTVEEVVEPAVTEAITTATTAVEEATMPVAEPAAPVSAGGLYSVVDGNKLDENSYAGFKLFRNWCARCHGTYGQGMVGPNLADSLKVISEKQFYDTVENGKTGTIGSMPAWKANVEVMENKGQLYAYLKARSDGAIGVEKPKKQ